MTRMPGTIWEGPSGTPHGTLTPTTLVWHSDASGGGEPHAHDGDEWHFWTAYDGTIHQANDTNTRCDAQFSGNAFAISVETASNKDATDQWSGAQLASMKRIALWARDTHGISLARCTSAGGGGQGYHSMFDAWNHNHHSCPGPARIAQFDLFLASLTAPEPAKDDQMDINDIAAVVLPKMYRLFSDTTVWVVTAMGVRPIDSPAERDAMRFLGQVYSAPGASDGVYVVDDTSEWLLRAIGRYHDSINPAAPATPVHPLSGPINLSGSISLTGAANLS